MVGAAITGFFVIVLYCAMYLVLGIWAVVSGFFRMITGRGTPGMGMGGNGRGGGNGGG